MHHKFKKVGLYDLPYPMLFDDSLTQLEKMNRLSHWVKCLSDNVELLGVQWNEFVDWLEDEGLREEIIRILHEWKEDGTLAEIINEEIFGELNQAIILLTEKVNEMWDYFKQQAEFDYTKNTPNLVMSIGGVRNAVNQSVNFDIKDMNFYTTQSDSEVNEGFFISQLGPSGKLVSSMWLPEAGHGTMIGLDRSTGNLKIWATIERTNKLVYFNYSGDSKLTLSQQNALTDYTPNSLRYIPFTPTYDPYHDNIVLRRNDGVVEIRKRIDILNKVDRVIYSVNTDSSQNSNSTPMQGCVAFGSKIYYMSGSSTSPLRICEYDGETNTKLKDYNLQTLVGEDGNYLFRDNFHEPEGLTFYLNPQTGNKSLLFVVTTGGTIRRHHNMYSISHQDIDTFWSGLTRAGSQNYAFTKGDGRALSLKEGVTSLDDIYEPGIYHITNGVAQGISGFPYPILDSAWYLTVYPQNQVLDGMQILTRFSVNRRNLSFSRTFTYNRENFEYNFSSNWTVDVKASQYQEYAEASVWDNKIANIVVPGEYYITQPQMFLYTDSPVNNGGFRLIVSSGDSEGRVRQTLIRNSDSIIEEFVRNVVVSSKVASAWMQNRTRELIYTTLTLTNGATGSLKVSNNGSFLIFKGGVEFNGDGVFANLPTAYRPTETVIVSIGNGKITINANGQIRSDDMFGEIITGLHFIVSIY